MVLKYFKLGKKAVDVAKKGYEMIRPVGKSTVEGRGKVGLIKRVNKAIKESEGAAASGSEAIEKAKRPLSYYKDTGESTRTSKRTVEAAKTLRDTKRQKRKLEKVREDIYEMETPMEFESYKHGGMVKQSCQIKGWGKARKR